MLNQDFKEFIKSLNDNNVRHLVVGGYAVVSSRIYTVFIHTALPPQAVPELPQVTGTGWPAG